MNTEAEWVFVEWICMDCGWCEHYMFSEAWSPVALVTCSRQRKLTAHRRTRQAQDVHPGAA